MVMGGHSKRERKGLRFVVLVVVLSVVYVVCFGERGKGGLLSHLCQTRNRSIHLHFFQNLSRFFPVLAPPTGGRGRLMSLPCLESQGCHLILLHCLLSCFSAKFSYSFCLIFFFSACCSFLLKFFQKILQHFSLRWAFFVWLLLAVKGSKLVGGMCCMLPYGTGIFCYAFI